MAILLVLGGVRPSMAVPLAGRTAWPNVSVAGGGTARIDIYSEGLGSRSHPAWSRPRCRGWVHLLRSGLIAFMRFGAWPVAIVLILFWFREPIKGALPNIGEVSVGGWMKVRFNQSVAELDAKYKLGGVSSDRTSRRLRRLLEEYDFGVLAGARILWIDDHPENNIHERRATGAWGASFVLVTDGDSAVNQVKAQFFDIVVSDYRRPGDGTDGLRIVSVICQAERASGRPRTPLIFYTWYETGDEGAFRAEALHEGAFGYTRDPVELLGLIVRALAPVETFRRSD